MADEERLKESIGFPRVVLIDTVSFCNLRCSMCAHKVMKRRKGRMPWGLFVDIINQIAAIDKGVRVWMVFFGEALLLQKKKPTIFEMIAYAKAKGLRDVVLNSNANLLNGEAAQGIIDSGLDALYVGLDAFSPKTYSELRVGGDYQRAVNNIINLVDLKKRMDSKKPEIFVQFVEMDINKDEKEDFINFWKNYAVRVKIRPKVSWAGIVDAPDLVLGNEERQPCHWVMQTMSITDRGKVVLCAVDLDARCITGDTNKELLKDIWNGRLKEIRQLHISRRFQDLPDICRDCRDWQAARADYF